MIETPENNALENAKVETPEKKWTDDVLVPVPLTEFLKMKKKIMKLEHEKKEITEKRWAVELEKGNLQKAYNEMKKDYQKVLGIKEEGDDKK